MRSGRDSSARTGWLSHQGGRAYRRSSWLYISHGRMATGRRGGQPMRRLEERRLLASGARAVPLWMREVGGRADQYDVGLHGMNGLCFHLKPNAAIVFSTATSSRVDKTSHVLPHVLSTSCPPIVSQANAVPILPSHQVNSTPCGCCRRHPRLKVFSPSVYCTSFLCTSVMKYGKTCSTGGYSWTISLFGVLLGRRSALGRSPIRLACRV